jgi:acyl dehydratase
MRRYQSGSLSLVTTVFADGAAYARSEPAIAERERLARVEERRLVVERVRAKLARPNLDLERVHLDAEYARRIPPGEPEEIMALAIADTLDEIDAIERGEPGT